MKCVIILSLFIIVGFQSCIVTPKFGVNTSFTDFRPYLEKGFYMSTQSDVPSGYIPLGYVECAVKSGEDLSSGGVKTSLAGPMKGENRIATTEDAINAAYEQALKIEANGIVGLDFSFVTDQLGNVAKTTARGLAIKKK